MSTMSVSLTDMSYRELSDIIDNAILLSWELSDIVDDIILLSGG